MYDELIVVDVMSGARLNEIIAANPPVNMTYPKVGPDTPCKLLPTEADEAVRGVRVIADKSEKMKFAVANYYPQVGLEIPNLRHRYDN